MLLSSEKELCLFQPIFFFLAYLNSTNSVTVIFTLKLKG